MADDSGAGKMTPEQEAQATLAAIVEFSDDAIIGKTRDGVITSWNRGAEKIYGYSAEEAIGRHISLLAPPDRLDELRRVMDRVRQGEHVEHLETTRLTKDGRSIKVSLTLSPIFRADGTLVGVSTIARDITEQSRLEQLLRESEKRYHTQIELAGDAIVVHENGRFIYANCAALGIYGAASLEQLQQVGVLDLVHPEERANVRARIERLLQGEEIPLRECRLLRLDGQTVPVETSSVMIDYQGKPSIQVIARDISDRKRAEAERKIAEQKLQDSERRHRLLFETSLQGILYIDAADRVLLANPAAERVLGKSSGELQGRKMSELGFDIRREDGSALPEGEIPCTRALFTGKEIRDVVMQIAKNGNGDLRWLSVSAVPLFRAGSERPYQIYAVFEDITPRRLAEEALRASEAKFRWLFASNLIAIFFWNRDGRITEANQAYCDLVGYSSGECQAGKLNWLDTTPPDQYDRDFAAVEEIRAFGICKPYEKEFIHRSDGHRVPVLCAGARMVGSESEGMGFAIDLTELKRAEKAMRESEATLKLAIETTGLGTFDWDLVTGKQYWSDIAKLHFGLPPQAKVDGDTFARGLHPEDRERVLDILRLALAPSGEGKYSAKYRTVGIVDGKERWISEHGQVFFNAQGEPSRVVGACLDISDIVSAETALKDEITERLRAVEELHLQEQLLIRQGRLAALGEMIGNIAHQWRQPLNTLALIVQELSWYYDHEQFSKEYLDANVTRAMQVINHMSKTIDGFRNFFEPNKEILPFKACEVLAQTVSIVEAAFHELGLQVEVQADAEVMVNGNPNEFSQVILNILMNAKDALLERRTAVPRIRVRLYQEDGRAVLTITDNAGGVPPEIIDKIFDPYFTTKGPDKGTGIGLFMSKTIIEKNMGGTLSVVNTEDGAEFRIEV